MPNNIWVEPVLYYDGLFSDTPMKTLRKQSYVLLKTGYMKILCFTASQLQIDTVV